MFYQTKPKQIQAVQWDGTEAGLKRIAELLQTKDGELSYAYGIARLKTREGGVTVRPQDFIAKASDGNLFTLHPDKLAEFYLVTDGLDL